MPKAKPFPDSEEEEKTTIESQWEEEASTTVEQGEVGDKIRSLQQPRNNTNVTSTGAGPLDEPTVDDQHAQMSAITPLRDVARLLITQGNDAGQEIEIRPGKTYTIGRAIDNDVVLTDISVSRKHFDLRFEDGAWVIVDRGSGNGTVVNSNLEDNPFMLANGDVIEIGNTVFRFDQPNAAARPQRTLDIEPDDEEMSTVAGKPLRPEIVEVVDEAPPLAQPMRPPRPKTLPPPTPLRPGGASQPPPLGYPLPAAQPASTLPMPQMANRPPMAGPGAPTMLGDQAGRLNPAPNQMVTTLPGQGAPRPMYAYPQATEIPPHSVHAQMLLIQTQNRRGDGSTALVPPVPYDGSLPPPRYDQQLTKKTKVVVAGIGIAVFAAVMTVAIVKSGSGPKGKTAASTGSAEKVKLDSKSEAKVAAKTTATAMNESTTKTESAKTPATTTTTTTTTTSKTATTAAPIPTTTKTTTSPSTTAQPPTTIKTPTTSSSPPTTAQPPTTTKTAATTTAPAPATTTTKPPTTSSPPPTTTKPPATTTAPAPATTPTKPEVAKTTPPKATPKKTTRKERREDRREARRDTSSNPSPTPAPPKRVAAADPDAAKDKADNLYRAKKFSDASNVLASVAKNLDDEDEAKELRRTSDMYAKLGRSLANGTAPGTKPIEAFEALRQAASYDRNLGNAFDGEIQTRLAQVAPKAALSYMAAKNYPQARTAVVVAQQFGASESVKLVSQKLELVASELYNEGMRELGSNPSGAKDKFRQIKQIVDAKSTWYQKAQKQLQGG